jgi:putative membrane protein
MRSITRFSTALILGAAISACGGGNSDNATSGSAGGEAAAASGTTAGATDSGAMGGTAAGATGAAAGGVNAADLTGMNAADQLAVINASNAAEIATSKAAQDKLTNSEARSYARDMIKEHTTMQGMADQMSKKANVTAGSPDVATQKTEMANQMSQQLSSAPKGEATDRQYIDGQVLAHQQTLEQLRALQNASDSTVKTLATQALPKVQAHLERAQGIQQKLGGGAAGGTTGAGGAGGTTGATGATTGAAAGGTTGAHP